MYKKGKKLTNKELLELKDGAVVWSIYKDDGETIWNEPFRLWRVGKAHSTQHAYQDLVFGLTGLAAVDANNGYEDFVSSYSHEPNEQAARDTGEGMFLFHAIKA